MTSERGSQGTVVVNGEERLLERSDLSSLLAELGVQTGQKGVAVAVNGDVIPRPLWESVSLSEGDRVEIVRAVQGG